MGRAGRAGAPAFGALAWVAHGALILGFAVGIQHLLLQRANTLHEGGRWEATKLSLDYGILGTVAFLVTRTALHRGRLDLSVWHGQHELLYRDPVTLEQLSLRFRLAEPGALVVHFFHDGERFEAVRLSRDAAMPSGCLAGTVAGEFLDRTPLPGVVPGAGWHRLELLGEGEGFRIRLDGEEAGHCGTRRGDRGRFGVRGSAADATLVDDVHALGRTPQEEVFEDFENHRGAGRVLGAALAALAALYALVAAIAARRAEGPPLRVYLAATHLTVAVCLGLALATEWLYLGGLHPEDIDFERFPYENRIEYESAVRERLEAAVPPGPPPPGERRVLLLGSSQTWGSGASTAAHTWGARLEAGLQAGAAPGERFRVINTGIPGLAAPKLRDLYRDEWIAWRPELVIVDLSNNDRDTEAFGRALADVARLSRERGIRVVFVPEPNSVEARSERSLAGLRERHVRMREVARAEGVPVVEAQAPLVARRDDGFLWWDRVHLTDFGHALLAEVLLARREVLLAEPPSPEPGDARAPGRAPAGYAAAPHRPAPPPGGRTLRAGRVGGLAAREASWIAEP